MNNETNDSILVINTGSSSIKFQLFKVPHLQLLIRGEMTNIGNTPDFTAMKISTSEDIPQKIKKKISGKYTYKEALNYIVHWIGTDEQNGKISIVAHRVVHGGEYFTKSTKITSEVFSKLKSLCSLAPLHQPHNLAAIELLAELQPGITQIACFDTAFHTGHDRVFVEYALPENIRNKGVRRYGFHGLSYEWIVYKLQENEPALAKGRIVAAHLGNGASLCAIHNGISIDTTMGMTALDGLPMGTRCGSLDPGVIIYLIRELGLSADEVESMLYNESGLKGLSNETNNVRLLQESDNSAAKFALDYFCMKTAQYICMMSASLGGIDGIVFTGGIGENSQFVRQRILFHLTFLNPFKIHVIRANEEKIMAMHAMKILNEE